MLLESELPLCKVRISEEVPGLWNRRCSNVPQVSSVIRMQLSGMESY